MSDSDNTGAAPATAETTIASPMRRAKFRDRERNMVFHGCLHSPTMWPFAGGVETRDPAQDPVAGF